MLCDYCAGKINPQKGYHNINSGYFYHPECWEKKQEVKKIVEENGLFDDLIIPVPVTLWVETEYPSYSVDDVTIIGIGEDGNEYPTTTLTGLEIGVVRHYNTIIDQAVSELITKQKEYMEDVKNG